jgi:hypothetical protein
MTAGSNSTHAREGLDERPRWPSGPAKTMLRLAATEGVSCAGRPSSSDRGVVKVRPGRERSGKCHGMRDNWRHSEPGLG